jgi:hypothetical protein
MADRYTLRNGVYREVTSVGANGRRENTVCIVQTGGVIPWVVRLWANLGIQRVYCGAVRSYPTRTTRLIAVASVPGADTWTAEGQGATTAADEISIEFLGTTDGAGFVGVKPVLGASVEGARAYRAVSGTAGTVTISGEIWGWAAHASLPGASVSCSGDPALAFGPIDVPANGGTSGDCRGLMAPTSTWTFAGTDGYFIEYVPFGNTYDG